MSARMALARALLAAFTLALQVGPSALAQAPDDGGSAPAADRAPASALPPELAPRVKSSLAPATIAVGEVAKLTIEVDAPSSVDVTLPEQPFGGLELADRRLRTEPQAERTHTVFELDLIAFEPGEREVPALTLRFVGPNGELGAAQTEPQPVTVRSLIANEPNAEPKPASGPVTVMRDDYTLAWIALGLLAAGAIAATTLLTARWLRNRPKPVAPPPPPRPAWELALERLHALARAKDQLFAEDRAEEFVDGVSDAIREYLGRRYGFDGLERTTAEVMATLEQLRPHKLSLSGVALLLEQCDLVKFARAMPDPEECDDLWNGALGLVRATTPAPSAAPRAEAPTGQERRP